MSAAEWLFDDGPGIYVWKVRVGWCARVMSQIAGTSAYWFPTKRMATSWALRVAGAEA